MTVERIRMTGDQFKRVQDVFGRAATLAGGARVRYLDKTCGEDADLRREVESLLDRDARTDGLCDGVAAGADAAFSDAPLPLPERIGPYEILGLLGRGGMGVVYRARQEELERVVALKVLRPALLSERLLKRFELEKQVLARLQHPGIAQILEAGTTDLGLGRQPWFAMELIDGEALSDWAAHSRTREKLELVARICDAVHHAHQKGVIHRDLKPDNILVVSGGHPRILDFGVARLTDSDLSLTTIVTDMQSLVGTLPYMSPEQAAGSSEKLDTRSDVYALGVVTYELLAGQLPYDLRDKSVAAATRVITDEDPRPLSSIDRVFRGDLETIVGKALEKDPDGRYDSAAELAADIRRFLRDEPIQARPPSTIYQLKKFARRNRGLVGGLAAAFLILVGAVVGLMILNVKANRATRLAESKVAMANGVNDYLRRILGSASPQVDQEVHGLDVKVVDVLAAASEELSSAFPDHPEVEAGVRVMLGKTYLEMGAQHRDAAERELQVAVRLFEEHGTDPADLLSARHYIGSAMLARHEFAAAAEYYEVLFEDIERELGSQHELRFIAGISYSSSFFFSDRVQEARDFLASIEDDARRALGAEHPEFLKIRSNRAAMAAQAGDLEAALVLAEETAAIKSQIHGDDAFGVMFDRLNIARMLRFLGRFPESEEHLRAVWIGWEAQLGRDNEDVITVMHDLAQLYGDMGRFEEGLEVSKDAVSRFPSDSARGIHVCARSVHAWMLLENGEIDEAETFCQQVTGDSLGDNDKIRTAFVMARIKIERGDVEGGERDLRDLRVQAAEVLAPANPLRLQLGLQTTFSSPSR